MCHQSSQAPLAKLGYNADSKQHALCFHSTHLTARTAAMGMAVFMKTARKDRREDTLGVGIIWNDQSKSSSDDTDVQVMSVRQRDG